MAFDPATGLFWLKKILSLLVLPPLAPLLLIVFGLLLATRFRRTGLALGWAGLLTAFLFSTPFSVGWMVRNLEPAGPVSTQALQSAQAIVILGGGKRSHAPEFGGETVNRLTLERLRYGARLARKTGLPVLVTGGSGDEGQPESDLMRATLETDFHVPVRWIESASRDTRENARFSAVHLQAAGVQRIVLVTHAIHMARARAEFEHQGFEVVPAPTAWLGGPDSDGTAPGLLPTASAAFAGWLAAHEWVGRLAYRVSRPARN